MSDWTAGNVADIGFTYGCYAELNPLRARLPLLMAEHEASHGAQGAGILNRIDASLDFMEDLHKTNPMFMRANPQIEERLKKVKEQSHHYLAHTWPILGAQGQKMIKEGKALETLEENLDELTAQATAFVENQLPILKALQIA